MSENIKISICIPTYECNGRGVGFLKKNIEHCLNQSYKDIEIIISDHSKNKDIEDFVSSLNNDKIKYYRNTEWVGYPAHNTNNAILKSSGDYIKLMNMDDYMESENTISEMVEEIKNGKKWVLTSFKHLNYDDDYFYHDMTPRIEGDGIHLLQGLNYVGCPSVGMIPKEDLFDTEVLYMIDCELWYRMFKKYGYPGVVKNFNVVIGMGSHSLSSQWNSKQSDLLELDIIYCKKKYNI